ncbi:uncharacterized protein LOC108472099 [Gossypium arboreum]|uniref:uncharacterized protein LOC108472099 n=1 Tax=Gossypium arboreum TaxID=29729 RepID=UPI0008197A15|nr:uncharacterized protein LOC108472099 [Gossypium arboreum]
MELRASLSKVEEMKRKLEELEASLRSYEMWIQFFEASEERWKEQLHHAQGRFRNRDYIMGEAVTQIWEVVDYLQALAVQADILSVKYELESDRGQELAPSGSDPVNNSNYPLVPNLDEVAEEEKARMESQKQLEKRCKLLEEKFWTMESADSYHGIDAKVLSLVPDLILPPKFKMPKFEKYNGTSCPEAYITMFCRRLTGYVNNNQLLIHCFQDSLDYSTEYGKKPNRSFRQYAQRWREVAIQVQPPLLEKETTMLFINTLKAPFITHLLESATKSFSDVVMIVEMIENVIRSGRIEARENTKRSALRKKENEENNTNIAYAKSFIVNQPRAATTGSQGLLIQESGTKKNTKKLQFMPIPMSYKELYQSLFDAHVVAPFYLKPLQPPYPKWYDANAQCDYHAGIRDIQ